MAGRPKKNYSLDELLEGLADGLVRVANRPDANSYVPHDKQVKFHSHEKKHSLYIGGNRSGKTVAGIIEDYWWLTDTHPYRETPEPPVRGRLVCVDFPNGWEKIVEPVVRQWFPPSCLINGSWDASWSASKRRLTLANGSFLEVMSYDQDLDSFAGASRHFTHFDEEPPREVWLECKARLVDTGGSYWITMTPVEGFTWVAEEVYEPAKDGNHRLIDVIEVDMTENTYLGKEEVEEFLEDLSEDETKARKEGKFVQMGGLIFRNFNKDAILPKIDLSRVPQSWKLYVGFDHGLNHPTAVTWHWVTPDNDIITFREHIRSDTTIANHVRVIKEINAEIYRVTGKRVGIINADPSVRQRNAVTGNSLQVEYRKLGVNLVPSINDVRVGLMVMRGYDDHAKWFITEDCPKLIKEKRRYRWKTRESKKLQGKHGPMDEPFKKDDDGMDSCRYFMVHRPHLAPIENNELASYAIKRQRIADIFNAKIPLNVVTGKVDSGLFAPRNPFSEVSHIDETLGGIW